MPLLVTFGRQQRHQVEAEGAPGGAGKRARGGLYAWTRRGEAEKTTTKHETTMSEGTTGVVMMEIHVYGGWIGGWMVV